MSLPDAVAQRVAELLGAYTNAHVEFTHSEPITEGWSAQFDSDPWPWVTRCSVEGTNEALPPSVIVKIRRPEVHGRSDPEQFRNERAALEFLTSQGHGVGPRLFAADDRVEIMIMEDLGTGPALEDLLVGDDAVIAERGFLAYATALGRMHATTVDPTFDRVSILGTGLERAWAELRAIVAERPALPVPHGVDADIAELLRTLAEPGPFLALSNGDTCPTNCRITDYGCRFIDFEHAAFRHALLDIVSLRSPFLACPCWSRIPADVGRRAEDAYRSAMAPACPLILDDRRYAHGLTVACAAWAILRARRLPKLETIDAPHPMGFSRRGQLLHDIATTIRCSDESRSLQALAAWFSSVSDALRARWPDVPPTEPLYPAFRDPSPT